MAKLKTTYNIPAASATAEAVALDSLSRTIRGSREGLIGRVVEFPVGLKVDRYIVEELQPLILSRVTNPLDGSAVQIAPEYLEAVTLHEVRMLAEYDDAVGDL